jgi:hypothetical protein
MKEIFKSDSVREEERKPTPLLDMPFLEGD